MEKDDIIDLALKKKQLYPYKIVSRGKFSASIELDNKQKIKKKALLVITQKELECRKFDFEEIQNEYTIKATEYEYALLLRTYIIHTTTEEYSIQDKIQDKVFRKSSEAITTICNWMRDISLGLKKIHSSEYVHLNLHLTTILITQENRAKIAGFDYARHYTTQNKR